jgi:RNA-binding protein MEX3
LFGFVWVPDSQLFHVLPHFNTAGCKIKALRAKTNTYIKTPVRGEDPIFIITGRPEDVSVAKKEILHAADHFSQIRARRSNSASPPNVGSILNNGGVSGSGSNLSSGTEEKVTIFVRVPYRVVGLVVGPKGATVKRIQQSTGTYIVTPSRDMEPYFEVRGSPENVEQARKEIESYIVLRTGGTSADQLGSPSGLMHCTDGESRMGNGNMATKHIVRRTMSVSETPSLLLPGSMLPNSTTTSTLSENIGRKLEHRTSPLSSAVFSSGSSSTYEDNDVFHPIPMSAPAKAFNKVFDFGSNKLQHYQTTTTPTPTTNWNGSWSPQPSTPLTNGSWGTLSYNSKASPQPPSPTGSWGSSGGKLSPQPPSPTGSWGSNSSEGTAVMSPRLFPNSGLSSLHQQQGYSQFPRASSMQQLRKMNRSGFTPIVPAAEICCCCEQNEADTILVPCGHKTTCFECACRMSTYSAICPHCNSKIESLAQQLSA